MSETVSEGPVILTQTWPIEPTSGQYWRRFSNEGVIREFAHRLCPDPYSVSVLVVNGRLYSYATPIARWIRRVGEPGGCVLVDARPYSYSTTTATKHRAPLVDYLNKRPVWEPSYGYSYYVVQDDEADTDVAHAGNTAWLEKMAADAARSSRLGPKSTRPERRQYVVRLLRRAWAYAKAVGLATRPDPETPIAPAADWVREFLPNYGDLAWVMTCEATGGSVQ